MIFLDPQFQFIDSLFEGHLPFKEAVLRFVPGDKRQVDVDGHVLDFEFTFAIGHRVVGMVENPDEAAHPDVEAALDLQRIRLGVEFEIPEFFGWKEDIN